ncbi:MAG: transcription antitermination factor NusB [Erysipelotrichaceae bacterium]|nr:transcription antitermination factor NusB [Erysipelotrichaceae bacterium]
MEQRELALQILYKTIKEESYSNLLMRKELSKIPQIQRAFVTNLVNGVMRNYEDLLFQFEDKIKGQTSLRAKLILCMALYERFFLNEKDYVVNNEYTELGKNRYEKAFINAVLHKCVKKKESDEGYIKANIPKWIYSLLKSQYDETELGMIIDVYQSVPKVYYRLNKSRCSYEDLKGLDINIINEDSFSCDKNLLETLLYKKGYLYVQDVNSASLYKNLDLQKDDVLLDVCCAPGSKLFNCLDILKPENCYGNDIHENRVKLIAKMADKLGFEGIHYLNHDGRELHKVLDVKFDKILLDAPCSGLGVIGRKPDLKFHIKPESLDELQKLQFELLESMKDLLKNDGILLYSTCTLNKKENGRLIRRFLSQEDRFILLKEETIINDLGDCFYYAKMKKVK